MIQEMQISIITFFIYLMSTDQNDCIDAYSVCVLVTVAVGLQLREREREKENICVHGNDKSCENCNLHKHVNTY
jgi:hypothetical protein